MTMMMESCQAVNHQNQAPSRSSLNVSDLKTVTGALASILSKTFGPRAQTTLLVSATGQASIVKDGLETLSCLHLSHPVAKGIYQAAVKLINAYGDGCKTMVIYLNALFSALDREIARQAFGSDVAESAMKNQMAKFLRAFIVKDFPLVVSNVSQVIREIMKGEVEGKEFSLILLHVISTYLGGCISQSAVQPVAKLVLEYLNNGNGSVDYIRESLRWFSSCVFLVPNKLYSSSSVEFGIFLQRPLVYDAGSVITSVNAICVMCSLDGTMSAGEEDGICLLNDPDKIIEYRQSIVKEFLSLLRKKNILLLICSTKVPSYILQLCQIYDIAVVDSLEESDIDYICYVSAKSPVTSIFEDITPSSCMIKISSCSQIFEGQSTYTKILLDGDLRFTPSSLFLCAPSEAVGKQLKGAVKKCLLVLTHLLSGNDTSSGCADNDVRNNIVCGGGYFEMIFCQFLYDYGHSETASSMQKQCCDIIIEMLTVVPHTLHRTFSHHQRKQEGWLCILNRMKEDIRHKKVLSGLNVNGEVCNSLELGAVEVSSIKIATIYSALNMAVCLLNVDEILSANKSAHPHPS